MAAIGPWVTVEDHVTGFRYFDARDLLGFVDGTENPTGRSAAAAALIGAEDPDFGNGSYVIVQKYLHDLAAWQALSTEQQERVIGRTKLDDIETRRRRATRQLARLAEHDRRRERRGARHPPRQHGFR